MNQSVPGAKPGQADLPRGADVPERTASSATESIELPEHVALANQAGDLAAITHPERNLAIWPRELAPPLRAALADPRFDSPLNLRRDLQAARVAVELDDAVARLELASFGAALALREDFLMLARAFFEFCGVGRVRFSVDRVEDGMCRAFHADQYRLRLICTYRGAGTEWLADADVRRGMLSCADLDARYESHARIRRLRSGWVAVLKGEGFAGAEGRGIVHRSPQPQDGDPARILVRLDC